MPTKKAKNLYQWVENYREWSGSNTMKRVERKEGAKETRKTKNFRGLRWHLPFCNAECGQRYTDTPWIKRRELSNDGLKCKTGNVWGGELHSTMTYLHVWDKRRRVSLIIKVWQTHIDLSVVLLKKSGKQSVEGLVGVDLAQESSNYLADCGTEKPHIKPWYLFLLFFL